MRPTARPRSNAASRPMSRAPAASPDHTIERLERRLMFSMIVVSNTNDDGPGSLRHAILDANATRGADTIVFQIPGIGVQTIAPQSPLPPITQPLIIDGTTQLGYVKSPLIELDGQNAGAGADGLMLAAEPCTVAALIVNRFAQNGIVLPKGGQVSGCYVGTTATGTAVAPNGGNGIMITGINASVSGSLISGNAMAGIEDDATGARITGNV